MMVYIYKPFNCIIPADTIFPNEKLLYLKKQINNFLKTGSHLINLQNQVIYHNRSGTISFCWIALQIALLRALVESECGFK